MSEQKSPITDFVATDESAAFRRDAAPLHPALNSRVCRLGIVANGRPAAGPLAPPFPSPEYSRDQPQ